MTGPSDAELRAVVRDVIARRTGARPPAGPPESHPSHQLLPLRRGGDGDGACLIEPAVRCTHCGYCLSYGH
jgi:hypothetical protein